MEREEMVRKVDQARAIIRELRKENQWPAIERCLQLADMNLHWCRWQLGYVDQLIPELEK